MLVPLAVTVFAFLFCSVLLLLLLLLFLRGGGGVSLSTEWLAYSISHVRTYFAGVRWAMLQMMIAVMKKPLKFQIISLHEPR